MSKNVKMPWSLCAKVELLLQFVDFPDAVHRDVFHIQRRHRKHLGIGLEERGKTWPVFEVFSVWNKQM